MTLLQQLARLEFVGTMTAAEIDRAFRTHARVEAALDNAAILATDMETKNLGRRAEQMRRIAA